MLCGAESNVNTLVCANAVGCGSGAGDAATGPTGAAIASGDAVGMGTTPRADAAARMCGICPLGAGSRVFGGSVGNGAGVGMVCSAGPGNTGAPGLTMCGVTTMISSLRCPCTESLRKMRPINGMSPKSGSFVVVRGYNDISGRILDEIHGTAEPGAYAYEEARDRDIGIGYMYDRLRGIENKDRYMPWKGKQQ